MIRSPTHLRQLPIQKMPSGMLRAAIACVASIQVACVLSIARNLGDNAVRDAVATAGPRRLIDDPHVLRLYVRTTTKIMSVAYNLLFPSLELFWPRASVLLVLDAETPEDRAFNVSALPPSIASGARRALSAPPNISARLAKVGYERQQYDMMFADRLTRAEFVGFVVSDTFFSTWVTTADVFEARPRPNSDSSEQHPQAPRPIIIATVGCAYNAWWRQVPTSTQYLIGSPAVVWCMTYFPVVVKSSHLRMLRKHVERIHRISFEEAWSRSRESSRGSQFDAIVRNPDSLFISSEQGQRTLRVLPLSLSLAV